MKPIDVYAAGSQVLLDGRITARVMAIQIDLDSVAYQCVWWSDDDRRCEWVDSGEVLPDGDKARKVRVNPIL